MPFPVPSSPRLPRLTFLRSRTGRLWIAGLAAAAMLLIAPLPAYMRSARYRYTIDDIVVSYWNPHVVVLPVAALLVLSSRLAEGRFSTLPAIAVAASFLAQTHVSLAPYAGVLAGAAFVMAIMGKPHPDGSQLPTHSRSIGWWINLTAWLLSLLWLLPLAEQSIQVPGNARPLFRIARGSWGEGAGIVLDRYRGVPVAVDREQGSFYGVPLAPTHREDLLLAIANEPAHDVLRERPGNILVSHHGTVYIYTGTELDW